MDDNVTGGRRILGLVAILLGQFMLVLDATVVNVALPAMQADLGLGAGGLTWVTTAYMIAFGGLLLLFGRLGDTYGRRRIFTYGIVAFTLASIACGLAPTAAALIVARFVQGIGAAAASSVILAIIAVEFPRPADRARAMSGYTLVSVSGGSLGLLVGGLLTEALSWHWIFWINVPVGALALALVHRHVPRDAGAPRRDPLDVLGAIFVTAAAMAAIYGVVGPSLPALAVAGALTIAFFQLEARRASPLLPLHMLRIRSLVVTSVIRGLMAMGLYGGFVLATLDMSHALGFGPMQVGLAFLPQTLTVALLSLGGSAWVVKRLGAVRALVVGLGIAVIGIGGFAMLPLDAPYFPLRAGLHVVLGLGFGLAFLPLLTLAMSEVPAADAGLGSAIVNLSFQLAAAVDVALLLAAASSRASAVAGIRLAYAIALVGMLAALTLAALLKNRKEIP